MNIMDIKELESKMKNLKKFFVDPEGELHITDDLHEKLAREICEERGLNWRASGKVSADDFLLEEGYIKFSNYSELRYVAVNKKFIHDRELMDRVYLLADMFNLKVEMY